MVKKILMWCVALVLFMGVLNPYSWYCSELIFAGNIMKILTSKCFFIMLFSSLVSIFILNYTGIKRSIIFFILILVLLTKVMIVTINVGMPFESIKLFVALIAQHIMGYPGNLMGLIIGYILLTLGSGNKPKL